VYKDIIEESWVYQENIKKGLEEGHRQELQRQRQVILTIVQRRFPEMVDLMKKQTDLIEDPDSLQNLIIQMSLAQNIQEALQALLALGKDDKKN